MKAKILRVNTLLYLALILALAASLGHVAFAFSTVNGSNWTEAYVSAVAIDLGMLALAAGINQRQVKGRSTKTLWAGVVLFSVISTYANWLSGLVHVQPITADVGQVGSFLVGLRPILLSAVLPVLVIYLSEIVSGNHQVDQAEADKLARRAAKVVHAGANGPALNRPTDQDETERLAHLDQANEARQDQVTARRERLLALLEQGLSRGAIAGELGVSLTTVKRDLAALNGRAEVAQ